MDRDHRDDSLELVRTLTREVMGYFSSDKLDSFEEDFAVAAGASGAGLLRVEELESRPLKTLDTTLVAGMFFRVLMETGGLPAGIPERVSFFRKAAKNYLVTHLSGQITLSQFYRLLNLIEENARNYFQQQKEGWIGPGIRTGGKPLPPPLREAVRVEALRQALEGVDLPPKGRKLTREGLEEFLRASEGGWFRVLDLERRFMVNKKTAWSYLNLLLQAGILEHNGEKANRVRYALGPRFRT
jgi:hypothetical protein